MIIIENSPEDNMVCTGIRQSLINNHSYFIQIYDLYVTNCEDVASSFIVVLLEEVDPKHDIGINDFGKTGFLRKTTGMIEWTNRVTLLSRLTAACVCSF